MQVRTSVCNAIHGVWSTFWTQSLIAVFQRALCKTMSNLMVLFLKSKQQCSRSKSSKVSTTSTYPVSFTETLNVNIPHLWVTVISPISAANILIGELSSIKLTDFGLSKIVEDLSALDIQSIVGTVKYMAPELLENKKYNKGIDIWSLGVTVVEMINGNNLDLCSFIRITY